MAHELADRADGEYDRDSQDGGLVLDRRKYLKIGGTSVALLAAGGFGTAASSGGSTYYTDFSSGSL